MTANVPPDLTFEQALAELETLVTRLERGDVSLDESVVLFERGEALKKHCDTLLKKTEMRLESVVLNAQGAPEATEPL
jgi:exodeoxyribonuclease VII small subunit